MKSLIKIIMAILGILGLSGKASAKKKAKVKKIDKHIKTVKKAKASVAKKKQAVQKKKSEVKKAVIITTRSYKLTFGDLFNVLELVALMWIGFFLMKFLFDFAAGMEALSEIDKVIRGY